MDAIFERISVRDYTDQPVEDEKVQSLLRAAMAAPSGGNQQPWQFVVVDDPALNAQLEHTSKYTKPAGRAPLNIVPVIDAAGARFPETIDQDLSACVENILLEAVELGLGAVWQCVHPVPERMAHVREVLGLPEGIDAFCIVSVGYPAEPPHPQQDRFDAARIHRNGW